MPDPGSLRVLGYHSIDRRRVSGELADYSLHPSTLENQIINLKRTGFTFVQPEKALAFIEGREFLPKRSLLLSFDDGYVDFAEVAVPILAKHEVPAVVFAVTGRLGETNDWDTDKGGPPRLLMSATDLRGLHASSVQVGAHSRSHRVLVSLPADELMNEVDGSMADLQALQVNGLRLFCYPYGEFDDTVESRLRAAGARAAFTVEPGVVASPSGRFRLPRIEILRRDGAGIAFLWKVWSGGRGLSGTLKRRKLPSQGLSAQTAP